MSGLGTIFLILELVAIGIGIWGFIQSRSENEHESKNGFSLLFASIIIILAAILAATPK